MTEYVSNEEVRATFPEEYNRDPRSVREICPEVDDELGLEIVEQETVYSKYGVYLHKDNSFHKSLQSFFDRTGYLTPRQLSAVRK